MHSHAEGAHTYRLVIMRRNASEILLLPHGSEWALPQVAIQPHHRLAEQLTAEIQRAWGLEAFCVFVPGCLGGNLTDEWRCAVMEAARSNDRAPGGTYWAPRSAAAACLEASEARVVRGVFEELDGYVRDGKTAPFARPGWVRELFHWIREQVSPLGLRLSGDFRQLNASPTFSLIRLETGDGAVWFKATGAPNAHELPLTVALARLFPRYLPRILGVHRLWNGWLTEEVAGVLLDETTECSAWERAAGSFAELQIASTGNTAELLEAKAKDLRIPQLAERIDPFVARMSELMAQQEKPTPAPLAKAELASLAEGLKEACALLEGLGLPDTLGHMDFNPGNILMTADRCVFLDWAEGCVCHPFLTFEYLREHLGRSRVEEPAAGERLVTAYLRVWTPFFSPENLRRAQTLSPLIAAFAYAVANDAWRSRDVLQNPQLAGYFRGLTRRTYREATKVAFRSEACLH